MGTSSDDDDVPLLRAWAAGSRESGNRLFRRHFARVFRFFRSKVPEAADELTQRTFLAAVEVAERIDPALGFRGYLFGIARNQLLVHLRSDRLQAARFDPEHWSLADAGLAAPRLIARGREHEVLARAMARLPLDARCALELFYWEELSIAEIAVALSAPEGTIKARLSRARTRLGELVLELAESPADLLQSVVGDLDHWLRGLPDAYPNASGGRDA